jgi:KTSC domain
MPSTAIRHFTYDAEHELLMVEFITGRRYVYAGVPESIHEAMRRAISKGGFFNRHIRDLYPFAELTDA